MTPTTHPLSRPTGAGMADQRATDPEPTFNEILAAEAAKLGLDPAWLDEEHTARLLHQRWLLRRAREAREAREE